MEDWPAWPIEKGYPTDCVERIAFCGAQGALFLLVGNEGGNSE